MACTALAPELESHGLTRCWYVALYCREHGEIRTALEEEPARRHPCPLCAALCDCTLLGGGGTNKPLPFHDVVNPPLRTSSGVALMSPPGRALLSTLHTLSIPSRVQRSLY